MAEEHETYFKSTQISGGATYETPFGGQAKIENLEMEADFDLEDVTGDTDTSKEFEHGTMITRRVFGQGIILNPGTQSPLESAFKSGTLTMPFPNPGTTFAGTLKMGVFRYRIDYKRGGVIRFSFSGVMSGTVTTDQTASV